LRRKNTFIAATLITYFVLFSTVHCEPVTGMPTSHIKKAGNEHILFYENFEASTNQMDEDACCDHSVQRVSTHARSGTYSMRFEQRCEDPLMHNGRRAELVKGGLLSPMLSERWYGLSIFLPLNWVNDDGNGGWIVFAQWHGSPDLSSGDMWRSPPLALEISTNKWIIDYRYDPNFITTHNPSGHYAWTGSMTEDKGKWTDWVFHVRWDYSETGFLEVWKNGVQVADYHGPIGYNDVKGPYFKMGIYRGGANSICPRVVYHDELRMGDENSGFAAVSPTTIPNKPTGLNVQKR